jgi:hypothetical protein
MTNSRFRRRLSLGCKTCPAAVSLEPTSTSDGQQCSDSPRWALPSRLTLIDKSSYWCLLCNLPLRCLRATATRGALGRGNRRACAKACTWLIDLAYAAVSPPMKSDTSAGGNAYTKPLPVSAMRQPRGLAETARPRALGRSAPQMQAIASVQP